jgi:hypothetical protein
MSGTLAKEFKRIREQQIKEKWEAKEFYQDYDLVFATPLGKPVHLENLRNRVFNKN